jgi:hypothetical protein
VVNGWFQLDGVIRTFTGANPNTSGCPSYSSTTYMCVLTYVDGSNVTHYLDGTLDSGGLLSGSLDQFGWIGTSPAGGMLEFTFDNADGVIQAMAGGSLGGMKLYPVNAKNSATNLNLTDFNSQALTTSWYSTGGTGDVFVPIPAAAWLFGTGALALLGVARRKSRHH